MSIFLEAYICHKKTETNKKNSNYCQIRSHLLVLELIEKTEIIVLIFTNLFESLNIHNSYQVLIRVGYILKIIIFFIIFYELKLPILYYYYIGDIQEKAC